MSTSAPLPDPKLLLSKYLFLSGERALSKSELYAAGLAVSLFQDAVESMIWSVAKFVDANIPKKAGFEEYWQLIASSPKKPAGASGLPLKAKMMDLNQARVAFKHFGTIPAYSEAERFSAYANEFLYETANLFFNVDFRKLSMADLVRDTAIRKAIKDAETLLSGGNIEECINATAVAGYVVIRQFESLIPSVNHRLDDLADLAPIETRHQIRGGLRYLQEYLSMLRNQQIQALIGSDLSDALRFQHIVPHVMKMANGSFRYQKGPRQLMNPTASDAEFCLRYVTEYAIQAQDRI